MELTRNPSVFDFDEFSVNTTDGVCLHKGQLQISNYFPTERLIEGKKSRRPLNICFPQIYDIFSYVFHI